MRALILALVVGLMVAIVLFATTGLFVVQPIGAIPEGVTVWYWRYDTNLPFVSSPDGLSIEATGGVSLFSRSAALSQAMDVIGDKIIARLPYVHGLYRITTDGREFEQ